MASPPKCRLCHNAHWTYDDHAWPDAPAVHVQVTKVPEQAKPLVTRKQGRPRLFDEPLTHAERQRRYREQHRSNGA